MVKALLASGELARIERGRWTGALTAMESMWGWPVTLDKRGRVPIEVGALLLDEVEVRAP